MPIVFFDRIVEDIATHKVTVDNQKAAMDVVNHLVTKGYKRIAHIANSPQLSITKARIEGYSKALHNNNIQPDETLIIREST